VNVPSPAAFPPLTRADGSPVRALVVDDEVSLGDLLRMALRYEGWEVQTAATGQDALTLARTFAPDVIVLDVMLPDLDGLQVLRRLRDAGSEAPVLFLTAKDAVADRVAGLTAGGDDYVTKPFSLDEVVARLRGLLRRNARIVAGLTDPEIRVGDLVLNEETYEVERGGTPVTLTATEFELLRYLMRNPRRVLSKAQILDRVWSYDFGGRSSIVEIYISYLRKKIDDGRDAMIHTVRGVGYTIKPATSESAA
jgi:two-component system OmpR family response regulator